ncbi:MAG: hypothetical protein ABW277_23900 [Longimicrobiaceae bacterium]
MSTPDRDPPFEGGSQPVPHVKDEVPTKGRSVGQGVAVVLGVLALLGAAVWLLSPILAG